MAAPSFNNHDYQQNSSTNSTTITLGAPGNLSLSAGDLLVAYVCSAVFNTFWYTPTGWNLFDNASYTDTQACFWKVASASDVNRISGWTFQVANSARVCGVMFNVSGANTTSPFDGTGYLEQGGSGNQPSSNAFSNNTSYIGDFLYVAQFMIEGKNASGFTAPSGYTAVGSNPGIETTGGGSPSGHIGCGIAYKQVTNTNLNPAAVFTTGSDGWTATMLRIKEAPTGSTSFQGKLGDLTVSKMYLGDTEVTGGYLGDIDLWA